MSTLEKRQLELLTRSATLDPPVCVMGGYAEDALLAGTVTRPHVDVDWLVPRSELPLRVSQAADLGFAELETWGDSAPGEPFYLYGESGELKLEITDEGDGQPVLRIRKLYFDLEGREPPAGYQVRLPADTYMHPPVELDGLAIRAASPLALYQLRAGIASQGSFGPLTERQTRAMEQLRDAFFPGVDPRELEPAIEPLP